MHYFVFRINSLKMMHFQINNLKVAPFTINKSNVCLSKPNFTLQAAITKKIQTFKNYISQGLL